MQCYFFMEFVQKQQKTWTFRSDHFDITNFQTIAGVFPTYKQVWTLLALLNIGFLDLISHQYKMLVGLIVPYIKVTMETVMPLNFRF